MPVCFMAEAYVTGLSEKKESAVNNDAMLE